MATPFITKNVKREEHKLNNLQDSDTNSESTLSSDSSECLHLFESLESCESSDSESEDETLVQQKYTRLWLNSDVTLIIPINDEDTYQSCVIKCVSWSSEERRHNPLPLKENDFEITDVYKTDITTSTDVSIEMKVYLPKTKMSHDMLFKYFLLIETDNHKWCIFESKLDITNNTLLTEITEDDIQIKSICAIARRNSEKFVVPEDGFDFVSSFDSRLKLDFPKGAVGQATDMEMLILPTDQQRVRELKEYKPDIFNTVVNMSDVISVRYEHTKEFMKNVKIQVPMSSDTTDDDYDIVFVRWNESEPEIFSDMVIEEEEPDIYSTEVTHFSDVAVALIDRKASRESIPYAIDVLSGKSETCNILTYYTYNVLRTRPSLQVELVRSKNKEHIRKTRKAEGILKELPLSLSPDMQIKTNERVHVALKNNIQFPPGYSRASFFLKLFRQSESNRLCFPVFQKNLMHSTHIVVIEYKFSHSNELYAIHFDPDTLEKNLLLPTRKDWKCQILGMQQNDNKTTSPRKNVRCDLQRMNTQIPKANKIQAPIKLSQEPQVTKLPGIRLPSAVSKSSPSTSTETKLKNQASTSENNLPCILQIRQNSNFKSPPNQAWPVQSPKETPRQCPQHEESVTLEKITDRGATEDPMFSEQSMMTLANKYDNKIGNQLAIYLGFSHAEIKTISREADYDGFDVNFEILVTWLRKTKERCQQRFKLLKTAFENIDKRDFVEMLERVRRENRSFTIKDKP